MKNIVDFHIDEGMNFEANDIFIKVIKYCRKFNIYLTKFYNSSKNLHKNTVNSYHKITP